MSLSLSLVGIVASAPQHSQVTYPVPKSNNSIARGIRQSPPQESAAEGKIRLREYDDSQDVKSGFSLTILSCPVPIPSSLRIDSQFPVPVPAQPGPGLLNQRIGSRIRPLVLSTDASLPVKPFTPSSSVYQPTCLPLRPTFTPAILPLPLLATVARARTTAQASTRSESKLDLIKSTANPTNNPPPWHVRPDHRRLSRPISIVASLPLALSPLRSRLVSRPLSYWIWP